MSILNTTSTLTALITNNARYKLLWVTIVAIHPGGGKLLKGFSTQTCTSYRGLLEKRLVDNDVVWDTLNELYGILLLANGDVDPELKAFRKSMNAVIVEHSDTGLNAVEKIMDANKAFYVLLLMDLVAMSLPVPVQPKRRSA